MGLKNVVLLAFDGTIEMSIAIHRDIFFAGGLALKRTLGESAVAVESLVQVATQDGKPIRTFSGSMVHADTSIDAIKKADLVLISAVWGDAKSFVEKHQKVVEWLKVQHSQGALIAVLSSSTFLLAETGLLDGKSATIYWRMVDEFRALYPQVKLQPERTITSAGNLFCCAGIGSGLELAVYLMERVWGGGVAQKVVQNFLMDINRESPIFLLVFDEQKKHSDQSILIAQQWFETNYAANVLMEQVADSVGLSVRSFMRRFKKATGDTPLHYLQKVRIEIAKELLERRMLSVDEVSYRVGYEDVQFFGRLFKRDTQQTPKEFRISRRDLTT